MKRINAWSSPRNISTAFMYAFAQREDTTVVDEPLYAHYLAHTANANAELHPAREEVLQSQSTDGETVVQKVILGSYPTPVVLFKQMTHHLIELDWSFLRKTDNILLIRNPRAIIASYAKVIPHPTIEDIGVKKQLELFDYLWEADALRAIVDARELLLDPAGVLRQLCRRLGLEFNASMLSWKPGPRPEDGVWAPYWYDAVHRSSGFLAYEERPLELPPALEELAAECEPYYQTLFDLALRAGTGNH